MSTPKKPVEPIPAPRMKRRDLLEVSALLRRQKLDPSDEMALGLGTQFLTEKRSGETSLTFGQWLDEDIPQDDEGEAEDEESDPTPA
jgi:hypothetical protein